MEKMRLWRGRSYQNWVSWARNGVEMRLPIFQSAVLSSTMAHSPSLCGTTQIRTCSPISIMGLLHKMFPSFSLKSRKTFCNQQNKTVMLLVERLSNGKKTDCYRHRSSVYLWVSWDSLVSFVIKLSHWLWPHLRIGIIVLKEWQHFPKFLFFPYFLFPWVTLFLYSPRCERSSQFH